MKKTKKLIQLDPVYQNKIKIAHNDFFSLCEPLCPYAQDYISFWFDEKTKNVFCTAMDNDFLSEHYIKIIIKTAKNGRFLGYTKENIV